MLEKQLKAVEDPNTVYKLITCYGEERNSLQFEGIRPQPLDERCKQQRREFSSQVLTIGAPTPPTPAGPRPPARTPLAALSTPHTARTLGLVGEEKHAVCIAGNKWEALPLSYPSMKKNFLDLNDVAVFIYFAVETDDDPDQIRGALATLFGNKLKAVKIEKPNSVQFLTSTRCTTDKMKMFYGYNACANLIGVHEKERGKPFDVVIRARPDMTFDTPLQLLKSAALVVPNPHNNRFSPPWQTLCQSGWCQWPGSKATRGMNDQVFWGPSELMQTALKLYDDVPFSSANYDCQANECFPEHCLYEYVVSKSIPTEQSGFVYSLITCFGQVRAQMNIEMQRPNPGDARCVAARKNFVNLVLALAQ